MSRAVAYAARFRIWAIGVLGGRALITHRQNTRGAEGAAASRRRVVYRNCDYRLGADGRKRGNRGIAGEGGRATQRVVNYRIPKLNIPGAP